MNHHVQNPAFHGGCSNVGAETCKPPPLTPPPINSCQWMKFNFQPQQSSSYRTSGTPYVLHVASKTPKGHLEGLCRPGPEVVSITSIHIPLFIMVPGPYLTALLAGKCTTVGPEERNPALLTTREAASDLVFGSPSSCSTLLLHREDPHPCHSLMPFLYPVQAKILGNRLKVQLY